MIKVGDRVRVVNGCDETASLDYLFQEGVVVAVEEENAHIGESKGDPFIKVTVEGLGTGGFWTEELLVL